MVMLHRRTIEALLRINCFFEDMVSQHLTTGYAHLEKKSVHDCVDVLSLTARGFDIYNHRVTPIAHGCLPTYVHALYIYTSTSFQKIRA